MGLSENLEFLPSFKFTVEFSMDSHQPVRFGFSKITGIEKAIELQPIVEGGSNTRHFLAPGPASGERRMIFEGGVVRSEAGSVPQEQLMDYLQPGRRLENIYISILNHKSFPHRFYVVEDAVVQRWSLRDLDAMSGQILIQQFEILYERMWDL